MVVLGKIRGVALYWRSDPSDDQRVFCWTSMISATVPPELQYQYSKVRDTCISNIHNTPATKTRQAITGVRQKAFNAHSSISTTLMD
jgi:hypothetical protein